MVNASHLHSWLARAGPPTITAARATLSLILSGVAGLARPAVQRPPLQLIYIKLCVARQPYVLRYIGLYHTGQGQG